MIMMTPIIRNFLIIKLGEINEIMEINGKKNYEDYEIYLFYNIIINILLLINIF